MRPASWPLDRNDLEVCGVIAALGEVSPTSWPPDGGAGVTHRGTLRTLPLQPMLLTAVIVVGEGRNEATQTCQDNDSDLVTCSEACEPEERTIRGTEARRDVQREPLM